jgi:hypothetical protein
LPHFGEQTLIGAIKPADIESFVLMQKRRGVKNKTVWNLVVYVRATFNWAIKNSICERTSRTHSDASHESG